MALPERPTGLPSTQPIPVARPATAPTLPVAPPTEVPGSSTTGPIPVDAAFTPAATAYQRVGALSADQLLHGAPDQFAHLDDKIVMARHWVQEMLTKSKKSEEIAEARLNPSLRNEIGGEIDRLLIQYMGKANGMPRGRDRDIVVAAVINEILGLGPIEPLWEDKRITEVMVNGPHDVYAEIGGKIVPVPGAQFRDREHLLEVCQGILMPLNRRVDQRSPLADGRLADGSRVNITHHAVAPRGPLLTIRRFPDTVWTIRDLVENGSVTEEMACELAWLVYHKCSAVIVGGTGSGKTSLLNALSSCIPRNERVITIEDALELRLHPQAHVAAMEARPASASGEGEVRIRDLVKNALRMRPDRIVVGEVRDGAALDMLNAMNTGHEGSMTTVHANDADAAMNRLSTLVAQGGEIPSDKVQWLIGDAVDLMIIQRRYEDGSRRVGGVYEIPSARYSVNNTITPIPLWEWEQTGFDENGKFLGQYVKRAEITEEMRSLRRLNNFEPFTMDDVARMSELPDELRKK